jgi:hypothetical protein
MNEQRTCDIYAQWSITIKKNKIMSFSGKWMELEMEKVRLRKISHFLSYAESIFKKKDIKIEGRLLGKKNGPKGRENKE